LTLPVGVLSVIVITSVKREKGAKMRASSGVVPPAIPMNREESIAMRRLPLIVVIVASVVSATAAPEEKFTVSGFGGYPISNSITSMWLAGPDHRPLIMVYFHGPEEWHNTKWKVDSKFEKGKPGWAELQSEKVTLRLSMNTETGEAEVQSGKFKINESNTFLVLHTGESSVPQKIISLGIFDLPASKDQPASVLLLQANPQLMERINKEAAAGTH
jgi:hypothetical protein